MVRKGMPQVGSPRLGMVSEAGLLTSTIGFYTEVNWRAAMTMDPAVCKQKNGTLC